MPTYSLWQSSWQGFSVLTAPNLSVLSTKETLAFILCFKFIFSYPNRLGMQTDVAKTHRQTSVGNGSRYPSCRSSVAMEAFILLFHEGLFPYTFASDLVRVTIPSHPRVECMHGMTCCISIMCIASNWQIWCLLPTKDTGTIQSIGTRTHSRQIWEIIVHAIF